MSEELRKRAEKRLTDFDGEEPNPETPPDAQELIHNLQVHRIELELQNEELMRTQTSLEEAKDRFATLYNLAPVGYLSLDSVGVIRRHNLTFVERLGRAGEELIGRRLADFMTPDAAQRFLSRFNAFFRNPAGKRIDATFAGGERGPRVLELSGRKLPGSDGEEEPTLLMVALDVTEQREAETRIKELLEQKDLFLRELRHRSKNNYQTVLSILNLQASAADNGETAKALEEAQSRVRTMLLAQRILAETGAGTSVVTRAYVEDLLHRLMEVLDPNRRVTLETDIAEFEIDASVADGLGLIINEAVTNAFKYAFSDRETGLLTVCLENGEDQWVLSIVDDGPGASADDGKPGSRGLGLNIVQALSEQLGGISRFLSTENGARLELIVPRTDESRGP